MGPGAERRDLASDRGTLPRIGVSGPCVELLGRSYAILRFNVRVGSGISQWRQPLGGDFGSIGRLEHRDLEKDHASRQSLR
jgi:hypothetical protein